MTPKTIISHARRKVHHDQGLSAPDPRRLSPRVVSQRHCE